MAPSPNSVPGHSLPNWKEERSIARQFAVPLRRGGENFLSRLVVATCLCVLFSSGCGRAKYEERLKRTAEFHVYLNSMNSNLSTPWIRQDLGMAFRPPLPFQQPLPGPEVFKDQLGEEKLGPDPRQSTPLGIELPGLVEAWSGRFDTAGEEPEVWMYLLSNYDRMIEELDGGPPSDEFLVDLERELMGVFQVTIPDGETSQVRENTRYRAQFPPSNSPSAAYSTPKDYSVIPFLPPGPVQDQELQGWLYERRVGKTQAALLIVLPKNPPGLFRQRVEMALSTWTVDNVAPKRKNPNAPGGGRSGGKAPNF